MGLGSALLALLIGVLFKGAVMVLSAVLLVKVYGATYASPPRRLWLLLPDESLPEVRILWWSLLLFCISEATCGIEIYVLFHSSQVLSGIHGVASAAGMGLFALGFTLFLDKRFFHYAEPACLANKICKGCTVKLEEGCKFRHLLLLAGTFVALAATVPWFASVETMPADPARVALPFARLNGWYDQRVVPWLLAHYPNYRPSGAAYFIPDTAFLIELRLIPAAALGVVVVGLRAGVKHDVARAEKLIALGAGILAYSYFELVLYRGTGDAILGSLGHELAELWFLLFTAELLRRCFPARAGAEAEADEGARVGVESSPRLLPPRGG